MNLTAEQFTTLRLYSPESYSLFLKNRTYFTDPLVCKKIVKLLEIKKLNWENRRPTVANKIQEIINKFEQHI